MPPAFTAIGRMRVSDHVLHRPTHPLLPPINYHGFVALHPTCSDNTRSAALEPLAVVLGQLGHHGFTHAFRLSILQRR